VGKGGQIVVGNSFLCGGAYDGPTENTGTEQIRVMKVFRRREAECSRYSSTLIPTAEGMTVAQVQKLSTMD